MGVKLGWVRLKSVGLVKSAMCEAYVRQGCGLEQEGVGLGLTLGGMRPPLILPSLTFTDP